MSNPPLRVQDLGRLPYADALAIQRETRAAVAAGLRPDTLLFVEHDPVITLGRRGQRDAIIAPEALARLGIALVQSDRGGNVTYHGPGQIVAYPILDLRRYRPDIRWYVGALEAAVRDVLARHGVTGFCRAEMRGVFTERGKICSIGVHISRWITMHGLALNVDPDMAHWATIHPCGEADVRVTSLAAHLGAAPPSADVRRRLAEALAARLEAALEMPAFGRSGG